MARVGDDTPFATAAGIAQDIAVNVLSSEASDLADPVFAALGIDSASSDEAAYFSQIQSALTAIEGTLAQVTAKLTSLSVGIGQIENQLTAISSQIEDAELQSQLAQYAENANIIEQNYQTFSAAIAAMGDASTFQQGTNSLFSLFQPTNADAVATAMRNVHDLLVGAGELRGIVSYQALEASRVYDGMAADPTQTTRAAWPGATPTGRWWDTFPDASLIIEMIPDMLTAAFTAPIIPAMTAAMALQAKGLSFLCAAWGVTIDAGNLLTHADDATDIVAAMNGLFATFDFDTMVAAELQAHGPTISADVVGQTWADEDSNTCGPPPFDVTWVFWARPPTTFPGQPPYQGNPMQAAVTQAPWNLGSVPTYWVNNDVDEWIPGPDGGPWTLCNYNFTQSSLYIPLPSTTGITAPANFTAFLATLPAPAPA